MQNHIPHLTVAPHNGAPCLHVDGAPHPGLAFWHAPGESGITEWREFARCGVHFFQLEISAWSDPADWNARLRHTIEADPEARIWLREGAEVTSASSSRVTVQPATTKPPRRTPCATTEPPNLKQTLPVTTTPARALKS